MQTSLAKTPSKQALRKERRTLLRRLDQWLETPMTVLGFVWLALVVVDLTRGLNAKLDGLVTAIWIIFIIDFALKLALAPVRWNYVRRNWLTAL